MDATTVWILGDQLLEHHPALEHADEQGNPETTRVLIIESEARLRYRPYQRKKLVQLLGAMRHYAARLEEQGYAVDYRRAESFDAGLRAHLDEHAPARLVTMASASYGGRRGQQALADRLDIPVEILPNTQFLTGRHNPIPDPEPGKRHVMEHFYRDMRRHFDLLMDGDEPEGGEWNYDEENRERLPDDLEPPAPPVFEPDETTREVMERVDEIESGIGTVDGFTYGVTREQALTALEDFIDHRLDRFGPYEDALSSRSHTLYHSVLSCYLNTGLLEPLEVAQAAETAYREGRARLNSVEGFIRQVIGWREFMYWQYWRQMPGLLEKNAWNATRPLPPFAWSGETDMNCMRYALERLIATGYNHHIERLMVISNFFLLAGVDPREANAWFISHYIDGYEWVMPPNVIGMSMSADGGLTATKPYIASANYINRMGDLCEGCRYDPSERTGEVACPYNFLYWNFVLEHEEALAANNRSRVLTFGLRHLDDAERRRVRDEAARFFEDTWDDEL